MNKFPANNLKIHITGTIYITSKLISMAGIFIIYLDSETNLQASVTLVYFQAVLPNIVIVLKSVST